MLMALVLIKEIIRREGESEILFSCTSGLRASSQAYRERGDLI